MRNTGWVWPAAVVAVLAGSAAMNIAFVVVATRDPSFAVERDYYQKALAWDATRAQEAQNAALGWRLHSSLVPARDGQGMELRARLTAADGEPIEGAAIGVEAFHNARASHVVSSSLSPRGGGDYSTILPVSRAGLWELRFRIAVGSQVFTATMMEELARAGRSP